MRKIAQIVLACAASLVAAASAYSQTAAEYFRLGNAAYKACDYPKAAEYYSLASSAGGKWAQLDYNMANACTHIGRDGLALLHYMRAFAKAPREPENSANLKTLSDRHNYSFPEKFFSWTLPQCLSASEWKWAAFLAFWGTLAAAILPPLYGKRSSAAKLAALLCLTALAASLLSLRDWSEFGKTAVCVKPDVSLRISPSPSAPVASIAHEASFAKILDTNGNFVYIRTSSGKTGWADKTGFEAVAE